MTESRLALVGRAGQLADLKGALKRSSDGDPACCLISGEAGGGKTRLLTAFADHAAEAGARVLIGGCVPVAEGELPFAPVLEAFRSVGDGLRLPEGAGVSPSSQPRMFELFLATLGNLARERPLVLAVEDLHWADRSTLDLFAFLARNLRAEPVMTVLTFRSDELAPASPIRRWLSEAPRLRPVLRLDLPRLTRAETAAQMSALLREEPDPALVDAVFARSEGNPLVTEALVSAAGTDVSAIPASLRESVLARLAVLPECTRALLRLAAAAGREVRHGVLAALAGQPEDDVLIALRAAVDEHVLVPGQDESYGFRHALIREVVYDDTLPAERRRLHAMLARALAERPSLRAADHASHAAEIAHHWHAAGERREALSAAVRAGFGAMERYAFAEALQHLQRSLNLWPDLPDAERLAGRDRAEIESVAAQAAHLLGEDDLAVALAEQACERLPASVQPRLVATLLNQIGDYHYSAGHGEQAEAAYRRSLATLSAMPASAESARSLAGLARNSVAWSNPQAGRRLAEQALAALRERREGTAPTEECFARRVLGLALAETGELDAGLVELGRALELARELDDPDSIACCYINAGHVLGVAGRYDDAVRVSLEGYEEVRHLGLERQDGSFLQANAVESLLASGRWAEAEQLLAKAEAHGTRGAPSFGVLLQATRATTARGDFAGAKRRLAQLNRLLASGGVTSWRRWYLEQLTEIAVWEGRLDDVRSAVATGLDLLAGTNEERFAGTFLALGLRAEADCADLARAAQNAAGLASALSAGEMLVRRAVGFRHDPFEPAAASVPECGPTALLCRAELSRLRGTGDPEPWASTAAAWDALGRPYPAGYARLRAAEAMLQSERSPQQAKTMLRAAYRTACELGAEPLRRECPQVARWHRIDLSAPSDLVPEQRAARSDAGPAAGLTAREREILTLVAAGCTNREIANALVISPKTASVQVSNILRKLGVSGRGNAARVGHRLGLVPADRLRR